MAISKVNLADKFSTFSESWSPRLVGELNGQHVKLARLNGEFCWHHHAHEDELFLVLRGQLRMKYREDGTEREVLLTPGEMLIIPRGIEHLPIADEECHVLLFEPAGTLNTGNIQNELTVREIARI